MMLTSLNAEPAELRERLRDALETGRLELPALPRVAAEVFATSASDPRNAATLSQLIERDPAFAAQVMRVANSPAFRPRAPVHSLRQAIAWLGMGEIRNIAVAIAVRAQLFVAPGHEPEIQELWRESVAAACWSREIARLRKGDADAAYLSGLLHRIGRAAAISTLSRIEVAGRRTVAARTFSALADEFETEFGRKLALKWQLPALIADVIGHWRNAGRPARARPEVVQTYVAHLLAIEVLHPELSSLSLLAEHGALAELGVSVEELGILRSQSEQVRAAVGQLG